MKYDYGHETERYVVGNYYKILVGNSEGKDLMKSGALDNIKMDHKETWYKGINFFSGPG
jgi:hypothetical protein